ncbi:MAG: TraB/GumN family protein [Parasphingorhabdus sp.]|uniref:TraB/GumN family protein n=1 Tax=Parasphingorhabdus sp. TaxID=2709688 RepID=UPI0032999E85
MKKSLFSRTTRLFLNGAAACILFTTPGAVQAAAGSAQESIQETAVSSQVESVSDDSLTSDIAGPNVETLSPEDIRKTTVSAQEKRRLKQKEAYDAAFAFTPKPALWKLSDSDSTVYIFGSIKDVPLRLPWQSAAFTAALESADHVYFETPYFDRNNRDTKREMERESFHRLIRHDRDRVEQRFEPGLFLSIKDDMKGDMFAIGDFMPTWLLIAFIADTDRMFQPGRSNREISQRILNVVRDKDMKIRGLEQPTDLLDWLNTVPEETQRTWLNAFAKSELSAELNERYKIRLRGENARQNSLTKKERKAIAWAKGQNPIDNIEKPAGFREFDNFIRDSRIKNWPATIGAMLDTDGTSFIVVDQKYLYGENNLVSALKANGHKLKRVR